MTNQNEDADHQQALDDRIRTRAHREALHAVAYLVELVTGRIPAPDYDDVGIDGPVTEAFSSIEDFVFWAGRDHEPCSPEPSAVHGNVSASVGSETSSPFVDTPS